MVWLKRSRKRPDWALSNQLSWISVFFFFPDGWKSRWVESKHKSDYGQWKLSAGKFYGDAEADKGNFSWTDAHVFVYVCICIPHIPADGLLSCKCT